MTVSADPAVVWKSCDRRSVAVMWMGFDVAVYFLMHSLVGMA